MRCQRALQGECQKATFDAESPTICAAINAKQPTLAPIREEGQ